MLSKSERKKLRERGINPKHVWRTRQRLACESPYPTPSAALVERLQRTHARLLAKWQAASARADAAGERADRIAAKLHSYGVPADFIETDGLVPFTPDPTFEWDLSANEWGYEDPMGQHDIWMPWHGGKLVASYESRPTEKTAKTAWDLFLEVVGRPPEQLMRYRNSCYKGRQFAAEYHDAQGRRIWLWAGEFI